MFLQVERTTGDLSESLISGVIVSTHLNPFCEGVGT